MAAMAVMSRASDDGGDGGDVTPPDDGGDVAFRSTVRISARVHGRPEGWRAQPANARPLYDRGQPVS